MKKFKPLLLLFSALIVLGIIFRCGDFEYNVLDPDNPDYKKTQIIILLDSTGIDSLFFTDTPVRIGISVTAKQIMDRLTKIIVDYGNGVVYEKQKPENHNLLELWCDSSFTFSSSGEKLIQVKAVARNQDDALDSVYVTIAGRGAYIAKHPPVFVAPFEEKDSLLMSVEGAGTTPLSYQWYKDTTFVDSLGNAVTQVKTLTGKTQPFLVIPLLSLADSGYYCCAVSNIYGADTSDKTLIRVIPETPDSTWPAVYFATAQSQGAENINGSVSVLLSKPYNKDNETVKLKINSSSEAAQGADFLFTDTAITFTAGETVQNITINVSDDNINESNETVVLDIVSAKNAVLVEDSVLSCTYTIIDNDESQVRFNTTSASITETDNGTVTDSIMVVLTAHNDKQATIDYLIISDSTTADGDSMDYYLHGSGRLTFPAMKDTAWIKLSVMGDTLAEGDEIVMFRLSNPAGGISISPSNSSFTYTIRDNDIVTIAFDNNQQTAYPESDTVMVFTVSLSKKCKEVVTCGYRVNGGTATGGGIDYTLQGSGILTFPANRLQQSIRISINPDNAPEPDETIPLELHTPSSNAALGIPATLTAVIIDDEIPVVSFKQTSLSAYESVTNVSIPVTLSFSPFDTVKIPYTIGVSSTALLNVDYSTAASPLVFTPGDTVEKNIIITVVNDKLDETDETVVLNIGVPVNAVVGANSTCTYTILDDEYVITPAKTGNGTTLPAKDTIVSRGDSLALSATPATNWEFYNWTASSGLNLVNASSQNALLRNIATNGTVTANFTIDTFTVTVNAGANGSATPTQPQKVLRGGSFGITATAAGHYHFYTWNTSQGITVANADTSKTDVINVQTNGTVTAVFAPDTYSVTVAQIPSGAGSMPSVGTQKLAYGTELSLTAEPNGGYAFSGWSITPAGSMQYVTGTADSTAITVRVLGTGTINANFSGVTHTVQVSSNNNNYGTVSPTIQQVSHNGGFTAIASVKRGCRFVEWVRDSGTFTIDQPQNDTTTISAVLSSGKLLARFDTIPAVNGVVYVDKNANVNTARNGRSWYNAFTSLALALDSTTTGKTFWVAEGTYKATDETGNPNDRTKSFSLESGDSLLGGFRGIEAKASELRDGRDTSWMYHQSILSGDIGTIGQTNDNSNNILIISNQKTDIHVHAFTIEKAESTNKTGRGLFLQGSNVSISNCVFNEILGRAIEIKMNNSNILIMGCVFYKNYGTSGSGIFLESGNTKVKIVNSVFVENKAEGGGTAIYNESNSVMVINSTIVNNISENSNPGGIYNLQISDTIINCIIHNNRNSQGRKWAQLADGYKVFHCNIEDKDSIGIYQITGDTTNLIDTLPLFTYQSDSSNIYPSGVDEKWFTKDDGLKLQSNSNCIDRGAMPPFIINPMPSTDILGNNRRIGVDYDIGAYEN